MNLMNFDSESPPRGDAAGFHGAQAAAILKSFQLDRLLRGKNCVHGLAARGETASAPVSRKFGLRIGKT
jgi:hypothetical protein